MKKYQDRLPAIVLDIGDTGYSIIKCLSSYNIPVIGVHNSQHLPVGQNSKFLVEKFIEPGASEHQVLCYLGELATRTNGKGVIICASDEFVNFCGKFKDFLNDKFIFPKPEAYDLQQILFKKKMGEVAEKAGLNIPETISVDRESENIKELLRTVPLPAIVKPGNSLQGYKNKMGIESSFHKLYERVVNTLESCHDLVISHYIDGDCTNMSEVLGFLKQDGEPLIGAVIKKIRQYPYLNLGSGTLQETTWEQDIVDSTKAFLQKVGMHAPLHVEFKRDSNGQPWFIEANYRVNAGVLMSQIAGRNIPFLYYLNSIGEESQDALDYIEGVRWVDEFRDWKLWIKGQVSFLDLLNGYRGVNSLKTFTPYDLRPSFDKIWFEIETVSKKWRLNQSKSGH